MENTVSVVVPYVTAAARLSFDALVAAFRKTQPEHSVNLFLAHTFEAAFKDPTLSHKGTKDLQIKHFGRAYLLDNAKERIFGDDPELQEIVRQLSGEDPERPKKARCCRSDWYQAVIRGGVQAAASCRLVQQTGSKDFDERQFIQLWAAEFFKLADKHTEGPGPLINRFREVFRVICGTPHLADLMGLLKRHRTIEVEDSDMTAEEEAVFQELIVQPEVQVETRPPSVPPPVSPTVRILENPYDFDWQVFSGRRNEWPRVFVMGDRVFFIARTYLNTLHRRVYEGGHVFTHKDGRREKQNIHDLPLIMQVIETGGQVEYKYTVTCLQARSAIGLCGKVWKNVDGSGDEVSLYRWFVIVKDPNNDQDRVPIVHLTSQARFNRFSEARLLASTPPQPTV